MKKVLRRVVLLGVLAGAAVAVQRLRKNEAPGEEAVQLVFDDGSTHTLYSRSVEAQEFTDIGRKVVEIGL